MDLLQVRGNHIVDARGAPVQLRGTCVGGWMNWENFIDGYPGAEHRVRAALAEALGPARATFFCERLGDYFFAEEDVAFIKSTGATVVRLPLNYRQFESDAAPFTYREAGFARLDRALGWCAAHGLYAILDLHAVPGWQNPDWHCDNAGRLTLFWQNPHYQDRFVALWRVLAARYAGHPAVAGYNVMNEPVTNAPFGRYADADYTPDWPALNGVYRRVVAAIREVDPDHIIFLEGDLFSSRFAGLDAPFAPNLVYSSHNYTAAGFGPGPYPGAIAGSHWDRASQAAHFAAREGTQFAAAHGVPLWVGEFGSVYNGPPGERADRLRALDDQLAVFTAAGAHWTTWTYKDAGVMGWVQLDPESEYMQVIRPVLEAKRVLDSDFWMGWLPTGPARALVGDLARLIDETVDDAAVHAEPRYLGQAALDNFTGTLLQAAYAGRFRGLGEAALDRVLASFALAQCRPQDDVVAVIRRHTGAAPAKPSAPAAAGP